MRRRPATIALLLIGFVLTWHACAIGVGNRPVEKSWVGMLLRVALQSKLPSADVDSIRPPRFEAPAEFHGPSPETWAHSGPAAKTVNELVQSGSDALVQQTSPTRADQQPEISLQTLDFPPRVPAEAELVLQQTEIFDPLPIPAAQAPIQMVEFSNSRFRPSEETWRGMLALNPLPVDRVRPAITPARYATQAATAPWGHWGVPEIPSELNTQLRVAPRRPHFFGRWLAPLHLMAESPLESQSPRPHLPVMLKLEISADWVQALRGIHEALDSSLKNQPRLHQPTGSQDSR